jgi:hypothetical protein
VSLSDKKVCRVFNNSILIRDSSNTCTTFSGSELVMDMLPFINIMADTGTFYHPIKQVTKIKKQLNWLNCFGAANLNLEKVLVIRIPLSKFRFPGCKYKEYLQIHYEASLLLLNDDVKYPMNGSTYDTRRTFLKRRPAK